MVTSPACFGFIYRRWLHLTTRCTRHCIIILRVLLGFKSKAFCINCCECELQRQMGRLSLVIGYEVWVRDGILGTGVRAEKKLSGFEWVRDSSWGRCRQACGVLNALVQWKALVPHAPVNMYYSLKVRLFTFCGILIKALKTRLRDIRVHLIWEKSRKEVEIMSPVADNSATAFCH